VHRVAIYSSSLICKVFYRRMLVSCLVILEMRFISLRNKHRYLRLNELIKFPLARFVSILKKCFKFMNTCTIVHFLKLYFKNKHDCEKFTDLCTEFIHYTIPFDSIVALMAHNCLSKFIRTLKFLSIHQNKLIECKLSSKTMT